MVSRLQEVLDYSQLSPTEFAERIDIQRSTISHILNGRNKPSLDFLMKVKDKFPEISWDWLILGKGKMTELPVSEASKTTTIPERKFLKTFENSPSSSDNHHSGRPSSATAAPALSATTIFTENSSSQNSFQPLPNQTENKKTVSRVMLFFTDGTFETFTP